MVLYCRILGMSLLSMALYFSGASRMAPVLVGYLGLMLQGGCLLAIGKFISTSTQNQIIAGGGDIHRLPAALGDRLGQFVTGLARVAKVVGISLGHAAFDNFSKGVLDAKDVIFYFSMIFFALFLTSRSMESLRWRA